ncbi:MAG: hypothetical protein OQJ89_01785 [Kangiellaceae bacterium]|nr:hypothetical protein [Kangiellaceae bacterium]MCW9000455.1 hypothetical protein [Kangiellaceae bacterium]MCW9015674.1 hypothetical protein [Kangiellaceae bacterium]
MKRDDFYYLVTNVSAIATQVFTIRCGEFGAAASEDNSNEVPSFEFNVEDQINKVDYQEFIDSGYKDIDAVESELASAWEDVELANLDDLLARLPQELPKLTQQISGEQLKQWVVQCVESSESFDILHQYIMNVVNKDEEIYDLIRESIASNDCSELDEADPMITSEHIRIDDLVTAAEIESFKTFKWLYRKGNLSEEQKEAVLSAEGCIDDRFVFEEICKIISPNEQCLNLIQEKADKAGHHEVAEYIKAIG